MAELLGVSPRVYSRVADTLDELAGMKDVTSAAAIRDPELDRLNRKVNYLSDQDQKALAVVLDSLVKRSRFRVVAET